MLRLVLTTLALVVFGGAVLAREELNLKAADGLVISADVYRTVSKPDASWIVLTHQAGSSRGEYRDIAVRLNKLGFNAIAIDQRSGKSFGGVRNQTAQRAAARGARRSYAAAVPDIEAAIAWAQAQTKGPVVLWGSSYSAALAIWLAGSKAGFVDAVVGDVTGGIHTWPRYREGGGEDQSTGLDTSPASERSKWQKIFKAIPGDAKVGYAPARGGTTWIISVDRFSK